MAILIKMPLSGSDFSCVTDVNECDDGSARCYYHSHCVNNEGGYECECDAGYVPWGRLCMGESDENMHTGTVPLIDLFCRQK